MKVDTGKLPHGQLLLFLVVGLAALLVEVHGQALNPARGGTTTTKTKTSSLSMQRSTSTKTTSSALESTPKATTTMTTVTLSAGRGATTTKTTTSSKKTSTTAKTTAKATSKVTTTTKPTLQAGRPTTTSAKPAASAVKKPVFPYQDLPSDWVWKNTTLGLPDWVWGNYKIASSAGATAYDLKNNLAGGWIREILATYGLDTGKFQSCLLATKKGQCGYSDNAGWNSWSLDKIRAYYLSWAMDGYTYVTGQTQAYYQTVKGAMDFGTWMGDYMLPPAARPAYYPPISPYDADVSIWKVGLDILPALLMIVSVAYPPAMFVLIAEQTIQAGYTAVKDSQGKSPQNLVREASPMALSGSAGTLANRMTTLFHNVMTSWDQQLTDQWKQYMGTPVYFQTQFGSTSDFLSPQIDALNYEDVENNIKALWKKQTFLTALEAQSVYLLKLQPDAYKTGGCKSKHLHETLGYSDTWFCSDDGKSIYKLRRPVQNSAVPNPFAWNEIPALSDYSLDIEAQGFVELPDADGTVRTTTRRIIASTSEKCYQKYPAPNLRFDKTYPKLSYVKSAFADQKLASTTGDCYWNVPICTLEDPTIAAGCKRESFFQTAFLMTNSLPSDTSDWVYQSGIRFQAQQYPVPHFVGTGTDADNHSCDGPSGEVLGQYCDQIMTRFKFDQWQTGPTGFRPDEVAAWGPLPNL